MMVSTTFSKSLLDERELVNGYPVVIGRRQFRIQGKSQMNMSALRRKPGSESKIQGPCSSGEENDLVLELKFRLLHLSIPMARVAWRRNIFPTTGKRRTRKAAKHMRKGKTM